MFIVIAIGLALVYATLKPFSDGLFDTSMWVAKILAPSDLDENETTKLFLKTGQAALMEGWLSNVPFITTIVVVSCIVAGFVHAWWGGFVMFFVSTFLGGVTKVFGSKAVSYYLPFLYHKMVNRAADYKVKNDVERLEASESLCRDLLSLA
jgi:hypothetical protein